MVWCHNYNPTDRIRHRHNRSLVLTSTVCQSMPGSAPSTVSGILLQQSLPQNLDTDAPVLLQRGSICVDGNHALHPFFATTFMRGPVRLASIVHAFTYRVAVLRDGAKPALQTGCSRKAELRFLEDISIPWDQQVAVIFQIVSALHLDVRRLQRASRNCRVFR